MRGHRRKASCFGVGVCGQYFRGRVREWTVDFEELLAEIAAFAIAEGWRTQLHARPSLSRSDVEQLILDVRDGLRNLTADPITPVGAPTAAATWRGRSGSLIDLLRLRARRLVRAGVAAGCW